MNHVAEPLLRSFNSTITLFLCPFLLPVGCERRGLGDRGGTQDGSR